MERRRFCRALAGASVVALSGCLSDLPGATGPRNPPNEERPTASSGGSDVVSVASTNVEESDEGELVVTGELRNRSEAEATRTVVAEATVDGDTTSATTTVTVPGNGTAEFRVVVPIEYARFNEGGSLSVSVA
jgi:hypothetical protein